MTIDQLRPNKVLRGPLFAEPVKVIITSPMGNAVKLVGRGINSGRVVDIILTDEKLKLLETTSDTEPFDGDPQMFRLSRTAPPMTSSAAPFFTISIPKHPAVWISSPPPSRMAATTNSTAASLPSNAIWSPLLGERARVRAPPLAFSLQPSASSLSIKQPTVLLDLAVAPKGTPAPDSDGLPDRAAAEQFMRWRRTPQASRSSTCEKQ